MLIPIVEGGPVYVEADQHQRQHEGSEKVLRRELRVAEGELFTFQKLVRSRQRLFSLGFFEEVNVNTEQGTTPDQIVVNIDVKERGDRCVQHRRRLQQPRQPVRHAGYQPAEPVRSGPGVFLRFRIGTRAGWASSGSASPTSSTSRSAPGSTSTTARREYDDFTEERLGGVHTGELPARGVPDALRPRTGWRTSTITNVSCDGEHRTYGAKGNEPQLGRSRSRAGAGLARQHLRTDPRKPELR